VPDKVRVLVVDDSMVMRRVVSDVLAGEADLEVQPPAAGGALALARLDAGPIDVVVLDVEMPEMSGLDVLAELRRRRPAPVVIMFSASTQKAAATTLEALALGASDYVTKPSTGSAAESVELIRTQLVPKIRALGRRAQARLSSGTPSPVASGTSGTTSGAPSPSPALPARSTRAESRDPWPTNAPVQGSTATPSASLSRAAGIRTPSAVVARRTPSGNFTPVASGRPVEVLAIGASTGGPNALGVLLKELPANLPVPIVIVQHMPPLFTKMLAERLTATTPIPVDEAAYGQPLVAGRAYLAPGDQHLIVQRQGVQVVALLNRDPPENSCRPAVDVLFRSVAAVYGGAVLGVILTGMGQDGLLGCQALRGAGAQILAQDEASSVVWGMPGFVARAGLADAVRPLADLPAEILRRVRSGSPLASKAGA
jgi:two-component system chemotaxis response regulator CheB